MPVQLLPEPLQAQSDQLFRALYELLDMLRLEIEQTADADEVSEVFIWQRRPKKMKNHFSGVFGRVHRLKVYVKGGGGLFSLPNWPLFGWQLFAVEWREVFQTCNTITITLHKDPFEFVEREWLQTKLRKLLDEIEEPPYNAQIILHVH